MTDGLIIDCFAGGGGASTGIEQALGRPVDIAVNHDPKAIAMHKANHPSTLHVTEDIFTADLKGIVDGRHVSLMWASPDCTSHSRAKGGKPRLSGLRMLPWAVHKHATDILPDVIIMENVAEIQLWGPLGDDGRPIKEREGEEYAAFVAAMRHLGYTFQSRELTACDYGAPTSRKRWYAILRRDNLRTVWPEPTHGDGLFGEPYRTAAECIDWDLPCPSVFASSEEIMMEYGLRAVRPLADATMRRIARGLDRYVIRCADPFLVQIGYGERKGQEPRFNGLDKPLNTIVASGAKHYLCEAAYLPINNGHAVGTRPDEPVSTITTGRQKLIAAAYLSEYYGNATDGIDPDAPMRTITTKDREGVTVAYLTKYKGENVGQCPEDPLQTVTAQGGTFGIVECVAGHDVGHWREIRALLNRWCGYSLKDDQVLVADISGTKCCISDIGLRMLNPHELMLAQGFPDSYVIDRYADGSEVPRTQQMRMIGNSVVPAMAKVLVDANCAFMKQERRTA